MNKVILLGNITRDPELNNTNNGTAVAKFTVAVQRRFKNADGEYESDFINCVAWRQTGEFVHKYFKKGSKIAVVGNIQTGSYEADDGKKRYITEVIVEEVNFAGGKSESQTEEKPSNNDDLEPINDDTLPF